MTWFAGMLAALAILGFVVSMALMLPLAMATDSCHEGSTEQVCKLSARGEKALVTIPWMRLGAGSLPLARAWPHASAGRRSSASRSA